MILSLIVLFSYIVTSTISLKSGESCIDSFHWIIIRKAIINLINDNNKCFQFVATVALNHKEVKKKLSKDIKS